MMMIKLLVYTAVLLLIGCDDATVTLDEDTSDGCMDACAGYMQRHWCSSVEANYTVTRLVNTAMIGSIRWTPLGQDSSKVINTTCRCDAEACLW